MAPAPRIVYEYPDLENTIPVTEHQASFPERFSLDDDKFVLCAGGDGFLAEITHADEVFVAEAIRSIFIDAVTVYVLNSSFLIFDKASSKGIEFPYQAIALHALREDGKLYVQVVSNSLVSSAVGTVEIVFTQVRQQSDKIFDTVPGTVEDIYHAMAKCSAFHYDSDSDTEVPDFSDAVVVGSELSEPIIKNEGDADDLEEMDTLGDDEAGMNVDIGYGPVAGTIRKRAEDAEAISKKRK